MKKLRKIVRSGAGQGITELALVLPLLLLLSLGVIEVANMINSYLTLTHLTREGANMASRGNTVDNGAVDYGNPGTPGYDVLDAIVDSAAPVITPANVDQWRIIYSKITDSDTPGTYAVEPPQFTRGNLSATSASSQVGDVITNNMAGVAPGQTFHVIEVFYEYAPSGCGAPLNCPLTPIQGLTSNFFTPINLPTMFYDRTIFTDVSGGG